MTIQGLRRAPGSRLSIHRQAAWNAFRTSKRRPGSATALKRVKKGDEIVHLFVLQRNRLNIHAGSKTRHFAFVIQDNKIHRLQPGRFRQMGHLLLPSVQTTRGIQMMRSDGVRKR